MHGIIIFHQTNCRALQEDFTYSEDVTKIGWMCPDTTSDTKVMHTPNYTCDYICKCILKFGMDGVKYIIAPIIQQYVLISKLVTNHVIFFLILIACVKQCRNHWILLIICPSEGIVYIFYSLRSATTQHDIEIGSFVNKYSISYIYIILPYTNLKTFYIYQNIS